MPENYSNYGKILLALFFMTMLIFPAFYALLSKQSRLWLKAGIEGDNKRLDMNEIWEMIYMFIAVGSFIMLVFMIANKSIFGTSYSWQEYSLMFLGTAGSNGVSAWIIYLKNRK